MTSHQNRSARRARQHGFTLVELMMTIIVATIVIGIAIPSFSKMINRNRLVTHTNDLVMAMQLARSEAITRNSTMTFCRAGAVNATTCSGSAANWRFWIVRNAAGEVVRRGEIPTYSNSLRVTSTLTGDRMTFSSDGLARNGTTTTLLNAQRIRICSSKVGNDNIRDVTPGLGSRLSTAKATGAC